MAAWGDGLSILTFLILVVLVLLRVFALCLISRLLFLIFAISICELIGQWLVGRIIFSGDAIMAGFYVTLWFIAVVTGSLLAASRFSDMALRALAAGWALAALLSVGVSIVQWMGALNLGIYAADLPPYGRPYGNVAQPNHLASICFIGLCSLLWLYEKSSIQRLAFWFGVCFLLFGIVMSQSRTGWLQVGLVAVAGIFAQRKITLRISTRQLVGLAVIFLAWILVWPPLCEMLLLSPGRAFAEQMSAGVRFPYWWAMLDAVGKEPWWGYGWQQVGAAQQRIALDHSAMAVYFEHSHNIFLDFLLWNGIPIGGALVIILVWWMVIRAKCIANAGSLWLFVMVSGVLLHAMLEFPIEYAYFLIPLGLAMGALDGASPSAAHIHVPRVVAALGVTLLGGMFIWLATEYLDVEEAQRTLRLESARIGANGITTPIQPRRLLTQLEAYQRFASTEATPEMTPEQLEWMRKVSLRFGYPPVLFRYALAAGLNGQTRMARDTLDLICRMHVPERCYEAQAGWRALQTRYPSLLRIEPPSTPQLMLY